MLAEAATSDTAGAFTDATMHATSTKQVLQVGVFDEADGASISSGSRWTHSRDCLFVWEFRIEFRNFDFRFLRTYVRYYETVRNFY